MDTLFKLILIVAFFSTLLCFGVWAQQKIEEYRKYWDDEEK
jgi:hypothetical protein